MLKEMDIFVRSHLSPLRPEQVALMRARWERDKRKQKEPVAPPKRRRAVKIVEPVAPVVEARPKRRRRTAAEVAAAEAEAQVEAALEAEREATKAREALEAASLALEEEQKTVSLEERAAALFKELPAAEETRGEPPQAAAAGSAAPADARGLDRKSTRLNSSHSQISYAVFCLKKKTGRPPSRSALSRSATWVLLA